MLRGQHALAASTVAILFGVGLSAALYGGGCSPSSGSNDAGADSPVCDPTSTDTVGCPCDPTAFKTADCYTGPAGSNGKGVCQTGKRSCSSDGIFSACVGEVTPTVEICNYVDDDCNGLIDDLPELTDAATIFRCNSPACDPSFTDAAITCWTADLGICGAGLKACAGGPKGGTPTGCNGYIHAGVPEVCNGIDDDCNGVVDDGLDMEGPCTMPSGSKWATSDPDADLTNLGNSPGTDAGPKLILGECLNGNLTCVDSNCNGDRSCADAGDQCYPAIPTTEVCNGKDDNCNGLIDEKTCTVNPTFPWCCTFGGSTGYCEDQNYGGCTLAN